VDDAQRPALPIDDPLHVKKARHVGRRDVLGSVPSEVVHAI
jgi:hypothetical protein